MQEHVGNSFRKRKKHDLLLIECQSIAQEEFNALVQLQTELSKSISYNKSKKYILIAQGQNTFTAMFYVSFLNTVKEETSFEDLDLKSQDEVLKKK